jgi:hypothetical protein
MDRITHELAGAELHQHSSAVSTASRPPEPKGKLQRGMRGRKNAAAASPRRVDPPRSLPSPGWPPLTVPVRSVRSGPWGPEGGGIGRIGPGAVEGRAGLHFGGGNRGGVAAARCSDAALRERGREGRVREKRGERGWASRTPTLGEFHRCVVGLGRGWDQSLDGGVPARGKKKSPL